MSTKKIMRKLGISSIPLRGKNRARSSKKRFETFKTLADPYDYFEKAMMIELEHGRIGGDSTNVTDDSPIETAKIVAAHLTGVEYGEPEDKWTPFPAYYDWLIYMEKQPRNI